MTHKPGERKKSSSRGKESHPDLYRHRMVVFFEGCEEPIAASAASPRATHAARSLTSRPTSCRATSITKCWLGRGM